ncbi:hypothetical protein QFZ53_002763 [Microbacterium natoriense]|uniref:Uncharacterized protein n=1 Tax=Microbacterium natoriense TaxID=284570 RepID=A0AAW8F000_9MICO|nr:hypothetical protein [Microbacterium natoriense]MDQ0648567.1 hypothetical protein [Microbacterium natoriense]
MSTPRTRAIVGVASALALLALTACSTSPGSSPAPTSVSLVTAPAPDGRVIATGTVIDDGGHVQLCLGAVAESHPPQCSGVPLEGWTWEGVDGSETADTTTWGTYAVYGIFDGEKVAVTDPPIMLALYDPIRPEDPTGGEVGTTADAELARVQDDIAERLGAAATEVRTERGYVWVEVPWDDGTLQDSVNALYGDGVVIVSSAFREVD